MAPDSEIEVAEWLADDYGELQKDPDYVTSGVLIDLAVQLGEIMEDEDIENQKALADRLDMSPSAVSQIMSGEQNMSIERLVRIALSLGRTIDVELVEHDPPEVTAAPTKTNRIDVSEEASTPAETAGGAWKAGVSESGANWFDRAKSQGDVLVCVSGKRID